jgi:serine/threonine protein kinase
VNEDTLPIIGTTIDGRWKLVRRLGKGGFADVYEAQRVDFGNVSGALKLITPTDPEAERRIMREIETLRDVRHDHLLSYIDSGKLANDQDASIYVVTALCRGGTLSESTYWGGRADGHPEIDEALHHTALGLRHLHLNSLVHRDVKPSNILLDTSERIWKLGDFGLTRPLLSAPTEVAGTRHFMAPETTRPGYVPHPAGDVYAYGVTAHLALTGNSPFTDAGDLSIDSRIDPTWQATIRSCLQEIPELRPTAQQLAAISTKALAQESTDPTQRIRPTTTSELETRDFGPPGQSRSTAAPSERGIHPDADQSGGTNPARRNRSRLPILLIGAVVVGLLLAGALVLRSLVDEDTEQATRPLDTLPTTQPTGPTSTTTTSSTTTTQSTTTAPTTTSSSVSPPGEPGVFRSTGDNVLELLYGDRAELDITDGWDINGPGTDLYYAGWFRQLSNPNVRDGISKMESEPTYQDCVDSTTYQNAIEGDDTMAGSHACLRTTDGRLAKIFVTERPPDRTYIKLQITVWERQ